MADNVAITAGSGTTVAADEVADGTLGTVKVQYVKLMDGTLDGTTKAAVGANGIAADIKAVVPGTAATSLGKAEDAAHSSGDTGVYVLGVRQDADTSPVSADGDYHGLIFNAIGRAKVSSLPAATATTTGNITASGNTVVVDTTRQSGVTVQVTGTFAGLNMIFEASIDGGTTYNTIQAARSSSNVVETTSGVISANPGYFWKIAAFNATNVRVRATAFVSGTAVILFMPTAFASDPAPAIQSSAVTNVGTFAVQAAGDVASAATDSGNPVKVGGKYNSTAPTFTDGQRGDLQLGSRGSVRVEILGTGSQTGIANLADNADTVAATSTVNALKTLSRNTVYNGSTWDLMRGDVTNGVDADVTRVVPGTGATNLGKAEDTAHTTGDTGVFVMDVSNENQTALAAASGDYIASTVNRYGHRYMTAPLPTHASSNGTPITATTTSVIAAPSAGNHLRAVRFLLSNGGSTATWVAVRDGAAGTRHYNTYLPQGGVVTLDLNMSGPLDLTSATRLDIFLSAAGSVEYEIDYLTVLD